MAATGLGIKASYRGSGWKVCGLLGSRGKKEDPKHGLARPEGNGECKIDNELKGS